MLSAEIYFAAAFKTEIVDSRVEYIVHSMPAETQIINVVSAKDCVFDQPVIQCPDPETYLQLFSRQSFRNWQQIHTKEVAISVNCILIPLTSKAAKPNYPTANFLMLAPSELRTRLLSEELQEETCIPFTEKGRTAYAFPDGHFVCLAKPDLIITTNDKLLMLAILSRLDSWWLPRVALPATMREWKFVNQQANYWGMRHFSKSDITSPSHDANGKAIDSQATGVTFEFADNDHDLQMTYLSESSERQQLASKLIKDADAWSLRHVLVKPLTSDATKISVSDSRCIIGAVGSVLEWFNPPWALTLEQGRRSRANPVR